MEEQNDPPEIPKSEDEEGLIPVDEAALDGTEDMPVAPEEGAGNELVPSDEPPAASGEPTGMDMDFDDLPDPPGGGFNEELGGGDTNAQGSDGHALDAVFDVPVKVQAVLGRAKMPISELVAMHPGYVFELDRRVGEPIDILVNDRMIARGEIVMIDGALGVTLTEIVKQDA